MCLDCPAVAQCHGRNHTSPAPGYWRSNPVQNNFYACLRSDSCLGGDETHPLGICSKGYNGILCANCDSGYYKTGASSCTKCPTRSVNILSFVGIGILTLAIIVLFVRSNLLITKVQKPLYTVYYKIFVTHFQLLAAVATINFSWPGEINALITSQSKVIDTPATILNVDCLMMDLVWLNFNQSIRLNHLRTVVYAFLPFSILFFSWFLSFL